MKSTVAEPGADTEIPSLGERVREHPRAGNKRGQSAVELALCLPVLLVIMTGIFTFGVALNNYLMLTNAVSVGGRLLAVSRGQTADPCATAAASVYAAAPLLHQASFSFTILLNGNSYSGATCTAGAASLVPGATAQVTATYPCNLAVYGATYAPGCSLSATIAEVVQ